MSTSTSGPHRWLLPTLAFAQFLVAIDYNIVFVALPSIGEQLGLSAAVLPWVVSAYALAFGGFLLLGGRLVDLFGRRRGILQGLALYGAGSAAAALAFDPSLVLFGRAVQGLGGALLTPAVLATIGVAFADGPARYRALSVWSAAGAVGLALGSGLGGVLMAAFGWRSVFAINLPLAVVAVVGVLLSVHVERTERGAARLDVLGAVLSTVGVVGVVLALSEGSRLGWTHPVTLVAGFAGVALLAAFALHERRTHDGLVDPALLRRGPLLMGLVAMVLFIGAISTSYYVFTLFVQDVLGVSALVAGLAFLPWGVTAIIGSTLTRHTLARLGIHGALVLSLLIAAAGTAAFALTLQPGVPIVVVILPTLVLGVGQAMGFAGLFAAAGAGVPDTQQGVASSLMSTVQQVGTAVGLALLVGLGASIAGDDPAAHGATSATALHAATWGGVALLLAGAGVTAAAGLLSRRRTAEHAGGTMPHRIR